MKIRNPMLYGFELQNVRIRKKNARKGRLCAGNMV